MMNPSIAEICAALIGDGWIESTEQGLYIAGNTTEDRPYYEEYLAPLFSKEFIPVIPKLYPYWSVFGFHTYKKDIIKKFLFLGIPKGKKAHYVTLPEWMFSSRDLMIAGLRGLFDTDGGVSFQKCYGEYDNEWRRTKHCVPRVLIGSTSYELIKQVQIIMLSLGFHPESIKKTIGGFKCGKNCRDSFFIRLNRLDEIRRWFDILHLSANPKHILKYEVWKKFGYCPPHLKLADHKLILDSGIDPYTLLKMHAGTRI